MLEVATRQGVATLTLARPDRGNALSAPLVDAIRAALEATIADASVHTLAFAGSGPNFCTGFDLSTLAGESDASLAGRFVALEELLQAVWHAPVRTVAVASGRAWGAGADLFASCDVRAATADATFRFPGSAFGIVLGTRRLVELIGWDRARPLVIEGATLDALAARDAALASVLLEGDSGAWLATGLAAPAVDRETLAAIRRATRPDHRRADLESLSTSANRPGLRARMESYLERVRKPRPT